MPSRELPASVGLKVSLVIAVAQSRLHADWSWRPWSNESMNSFPFHYRELTAPASRDVVEMLISEVPA